jgi:hypothetical protein
MPTGALSKRRRRFETQPLGFGAKDNMFRSLSLLAPRPFVASNVCSRHSSTRGLLFAPPLFHLGRPIRRAEAAMAGDCALLCRCDALDWLLRTALLPKPPLARSTDRIQLNSLVARISASALGLILTHQAMAAPSHLFNTPPSPCPECGVCPPSNRLGSGSFPALTSRASFIYLLATE